MTANPLARLIKDDISPLDFAVQSHGFAPHGRDYSFVIQDNVGPEPGTYRLVFTHVVQVDYETRVRDDVWPESWDDVYLNYRGWEAAGAPDGYVWGSNWSLAYPGIEAMEATPFTASWSDRLGRQMHQMSLETDRFKMTIVYHDARVERLSDDTKLVDQVVIRLPT